MARISRGLAVAALLLAAFAAATGFTFHGMDYGSERDRWFAAHVATACLMLVALVWWGSASRRDARNAWLLSFQILLALLFLTGWLALSAWEDRGNLDLWLGVLALPSLPAISYDLGNFGEQSHKPLVTLTFYLSLGLVARAVWRRHR